MLPVRVDKFPESRHGPKTPRCWTRPAMPPSGTDLFVTSRPERYSPHDDCDIPSSHISFSRFFWEKSRKPAKFYQTTLSHHHPGRHRLSPPERRPGHTLDEFFERSAQCVYPICLSIYAHYRPVQHPPDCGWRERKYQHLTIASHRFCWCPFC